jgi:AraC family transcriptional regulator
MQWAASNGLQRLDLKSGQVLPYKPGIQKLQSSDRWGRVRLVHLVTDSIAEHDGAFLQHAVGLHLKSGLRAELTYDGGKRHHYVSTANDVSIIPAYLPFRSWSKGVFEGLVVAIDPHLFSERALGCNAMAVDIRPEHGVRDMLIAHAISALHAHALAGETDSSIVAESVGIALAAHLATKYADASVPHSMRALSPRRFQLVRDYIEANIDQPISVAELANLLHMDAYAFMRSFKQATLIPPYQFVMHARVQLARRLLMETADPLVEIANRCGFCSQSHFGSAFRKSLGMSPKTFRRRTAKR